MSQPVDMLRKLTLVLAATLMANGTVFQLVVLNFLSLLWFAVRPFALTLCDFTILLDVMSSYILLTMTISYNNRMTRDHVIISCTWIIRRYS